VNGDRPGGGLRRLVKLAGGLAVGRGAASGLSAAWLIVAARQLSLGEFGDLSLLLATTMVATIVSERGLQSALGIHVANHGVLDRASLRIAIVRRLPIAAVMAVVSGALFLAVSSTRSFAPPLLAAGSVLGASVYSTVLSGYRSLGRVSVDAGNEIVSRIAVLAAGTLWLAHGGGLVAAISCYALADIASAGAVVLLVWRRHAVDAGPAVSAIDIRLRATMPLAVVMILTTVYYRLDTYLIGLLRGSEAAGLYAAAYRFLDLAALFPLAVGGVVLAHAARQSAPGRLRTLHRLVAVSLPISIPFTAAGLLGGSKLCSLVFGASFAQAGTTATVLLLGTLPTAVAGMALPVIMVADRRAAMVLAASTLTVNLGLNLALIPVLGGEGAAIVNGISQCLLAGGVYAITRRQAHDEVAGGYHIAPTTARAAL
jgi:O-antigen/teichoic acid export membrane protein